MVTITVRSAAQAAHIGSVFGLLPGEEWHETVAVGLVPYALAEACAAVAAGGLKVYFDDGLFTSVAGDADLAILPRSTGAGLLGG
ncbi:hypothetical protein ACM64Y_10720 [Novispirillum sp. DQ9]|uniref:hypothetical protein n=1 Tax=Novispirillum sp. DQ9 TaxID=3398612 RepID=UPI003C7DC331